MNHQQHSETAPTQEPPRGNGSDSTHLLGEHCTWCGEALDSEERESPERDDSGDVMCDDCYDEEYRGYCDRCGEKHDKSELAANPGDLIAIWRTAPGLSGDLMPGYYRVNGWPFFADGMIEGYFYNDRLERVTDLDEQGKRGADDAYTLSGPLCSCCHAEVEASLPPNAAPQPTGEQNARR